MMKEFKYMVGDYKWIDNEAFGSAWVAAKAAAMKLHQPIFRDVTKGKRVRHEVYYCGGVFNSIEFMRDNNVKVW